MCDSNPPAQSGAVDADGHTPATAGDTQSPLGRHHFDPLEDDPSIAVVEAVADAADTDPSDLQTLHAAVDPDALDALLSSTALRGEFCRLTFHYAGYEVSVFDHGLVTVADPEA